MIWRKCELGAAAGCGALRLRAGRCAADEWHGQICRYRHRPPQFKGVGVCLGSNNPATPLFLLGYFSASLRKQCILHHSAVVPTLAIVLQSSFFNSSIFLYGVRGTECRGEVTVGAMEAQAGRSARVWARVSPRLAMPLLGRS